MAASSRSVRKRIGKRSVGKRRLRSETGALQDKLKTGSHSCGKWIPAPAFARAGFARE